MTTYNGNLATFNAHKAAYNSAVAAYSKAVSNRWTLLSAVQGAIWQVVSDADVTSTNHDMTFDLLVDNLSGDSQSDFFLDPYGESYGPEGHAITLITPVQRYIIKNGRQTAVPLTQSFVFANVPEPATWVMMIGGIGMAGAMVRRQRRREATAA